MIKEIGFYDEPIAGGYIGWIKTNDGIYFVDIEGKITKPDIQLAPDMKDTILYPSR